MADTTRDGRLTDFGVTTRPRVRKRASVTLGPRQVGWYGVELDNTGTVYVSERDPDEHRYLGEDPWYDLPFDGDGYGLSLELFERLHDHDIGRIYIVETTGDVRQYSFRQFVDGTPINVADDDDNGYEKDAQKVVAVDDAVEHWPNHKRSFWARNPAFQ